MFSRGVFSRGITQSDTQGNYLFCYWGTFMPHIQKQSGRKWAWLKTTAWVELTTIRETNWSIASRQRFWHTLKVSPYLWSEHNSQVQREEDQTGGGGQGTQVGQHLSDDCLMFPSEAVDLISKTHPLCFPWLIRVIQTTAIQVYPENPLFILCCNNLETHNHTCVCLEQKSNSYQKCHLKT